MIIQPLITLALLGILFFTFIQSRSGHVLRALMALCVLCGLLLTWMPGLSHVIANALGVGRGADLVFYCWILASMLALVALYVFGGEVIRAFIFAMIWGVLIGTYSLIAIASPVLMLLGVKRDWSENQGNEKVLDDA